MKKLFAVLLAVGLVASASMFSFAEYVACLTPNEEHTMTEWAVVETTAEGSTLLSRTCTKCGYVQKGFGTLSGGVATTKSADIAVTTTLIAPEEEMAITANPSTGAAI